MVLTAAYPNGVAVELVLSGPNLKISFDDEHAWGHLAHAVAGLEK